jgi:hypothetical protein
MNTNNEGKLDTEYKGMGRDNPPLSATSVYFSESDKHKGTDEVGS